MQKNELAKQLRAMKSRVAGIPISILESASDDDVIDSCRSDPRTGRIHSPDDFTKLSIESSAEACEWMVCIHHYAVADCFYGISHDEIMEILREAGSAKAFFKYMDSYLEIKCMNAYVEQKPLPFDPSAVRGRG